MSIQNPPGRFYQWGPEVTGPLSKRVLTMLIQTLQVRSTYRWPGLTCYPSTEITSEEYDKWRVQGDRQRRPATPLEDLTEEEVKRRKTEREKRSPQMRAIHDAVRTALMCVALTDWELLTLKHGEGIHIALDTRDGVRCKIDRAGFVMENGAIPALVTEERLSESNRRLVDRLVNGEPPDYTSGLGHYGMGELLRTGANFLASWIYLQQRDPSGPRPPESHDGARPPEVEDILRQPQTLALLTDSEAVKLADVTFRPAVTFRRKEARNRQLHYQRMNRQPPASHRYA